jgi:hypothetical protein
MLVAEMVFVVHLICANAIKIGWQTIVHSVSIYLFFSFPFLSIDVKGSANSDLHLSIPPKEI